MDSIISLGQKNTLAEYMILSGADNRPPLLDKDLYDSWKKNGVIRTKKYAELSAAKKTQADCDMKATNIILQGLPTDIYSLVNHHRVAKYFWERVQLLIQGFVVPVFSPEDDLIACLNKAMAFLTAVASSRGDKGKFILVLHIRAMLLVQGEILQVDRQELLNATTTKEKAMLAEAQEAGQILDEEQLAFLADPGIPASQTQTVIPHNAAFQTEDLDTYDSDCDDLSTAQAVLMANISNYGSDVISEVPNSETYLNDMDNQSVHALQDFEQSPVMDFTDNEISSDSNIIPYSQYLQETQQATVQDTNLQAQQDSMILSVIEQMSEQMINHVNNWEKANKEQNNESITAELERYKERVKTFEQRLNIDLSSREKMIDSQMDDMIREKLALKEQIDSLEQNLSKQIKEKESLFKTFTVFKNESKEKENKYMENEIDLEKKIKELDNIVYKVGQSAQTVHMLTKPQAFYDNTHKQALGYQNPFYLRKAQRIKPTLYDGAVISKTHVAMPVIDDEETLILEEESRSKMFEKAKDPEVIAKKISHKPIDYEKLNSLIEDFETRFSPQQELSAEQAFWFHTFNPTIEPSYSPPVIVDVPSELPKVSLVNASLKKLKFHLTQFDSVVKKRTTPSALEEGEWGFEHTKAVFNNEIIPFLKSLKDIFNVFDKDLLNEITKVQTVFDQIEVSVQQFSVDKKYDLITVMNSMLLNNDSVNVNMQKCELREKCMNLDAELSKSKQAYDDLLKNHSQLEKHYISLEVSMQLEQEVFQNNESCVNQNAVEIQEYFEINDLKARLQDKDTTISKLKDTIKSLKKNTKEKNVHHDKCDLEPINEELENSLAKLLSKNKQLWNEINHVKQVFKDQFDSIKQTCVRHKEQWKEIVENVVHIPSATVIAPGMFKLDLVPLPPRKPKNVKNVCSSKKAKIVESKNANHSKPNHTWGSNATDIPSSSSLVMTGCPNYSLLDRIDHITRIIGYGDYQLGNVTISRVYYVEGLGHNLFSVGQFCDGDLEVAFQKNTCFIRNLEGVDLLFESSDTNLYTISLDDMLKTSPIYILSKASKTKSRLWHHQLSHLNFGTLNKLAKNGLARGIPRLKFQKDHLCLACALGKSKKSSHQPKAEDTNQEKIYLLHMDLCGPMRVASINGKRYILVFVDDYSRFTWDKKPNLSFFHVFGALCYPTNDNDELGKLDAKADIGIFVGYTPTKKAFRIYNRRTQKIIETIHVTFDELTAMASEQFSSGPGLQCMTPATSSSGLVPNTVSQQPCIPPNRDDWDHLFQPMFNEYFTPLAIAIPPVQEAVAPRVVDLADSPVSTSIDQDAPSSKSPSQGSSSNVRQTHTPFEHLGKWTKDHPLANVIGDPSRSVSMRKQLQTDAMWCFFDAFLTSVEPKNFKQSMTEPSWIDAMQEEIHEFGRLQVWELVPCPDKVLLIKLKWIYKVKTDEFGGVLKNKARLVAQGFRQEEGIDFEESFAPDNPSHVYKLKKALYGLKQAPRAWYDMLSSFLISQHFSKGAVDPTLFTRQAGNDLLLIPRGVRTLDVRSTSGSAQFLGDKLVSWSSKKQKCTAISNYGFQLNKIPLNCDNKSVIALCCNNVQHSRAKHIDIRYHFIKEQVENGIVELYFVRTEYQLADIFTKPLPRERFNFLIQKLGMRSMSPETLKRLAEEKDE
ncbi:integrase, catalytic region, zinc finger, CCHC-type containing protein [Tanacetum coccineum]